MRKRDIDNAELEKFYQLMIYNEIIKRIGIHMSIYENGEGTATLSYSENPISKFNFPCGFDAYTIAFNLLGQLADEQHGDILLSLRKCLSGYKGRYHISLKRDGYDLYDMETRKSVWLDKMQVIKIGTINAISKAIIELKQC